jgi:hypothetical protein
MIVRTVWPDIGAPLPLALRCTSRGKKHDSVPARAPNCAALLALTKAAPAYCGLNPGIGGKHMKNQSLAGPTLFLQSLIVLVGIVAAVFLLWEPHLEGRNVNATVFEIYFKDPFLAYMYIASIPFFMGLQRAIKVLGFVRQGQTFTQGTVDALHTIKRCAQAVAGFVLGSILYIMFAVSDDRAGGVAIGLFIVVMSIVVAAVAAMFERVVSTSVSSMPAGTGGQQAQ